MQQQQVFMQYFWLAFACLLLSQTGWGQPPRIHQLQHIPKLTAEQRAKWYHVQLQQLGVMGSDFDGPDEIGTAPAEREDNVIGSSHINIWYPNTRAGQQRKAFKQTMVGRVNGAQHYENKIVFPDFDIDFYVSPDPSFQYLITENPRPNADFKTDMGHLFNFVSGDGWPDCPTQFKEVEAEIDLKDIHEKQFTAFFKDEMGNGGRAGFYGPWIYDRGHCDQPEIHPAEQIWWSRKTENVWTYRCHLVCDYSQRFMKASQFDAGDGTLMTPWAAPPIKGIFAIPFSVKPGVEKVIYQLFQHASHNINSNNTVAFDTHKAHHLVLNGQTLVSVAEPEDKTMKISFESMGYDENGTVLGYLVITTAVGNRNNQEPGHSFFEVKKFQQALGATPVPVKIKVTLESIECTGADDGDSPEDIYGLVLAKGFMIRDSVTMSREKVLSQSPQSWSGCPFGTDVLWCLQCPKWLEFTKGHKSTFGSHFIYDFPAPGFLEITANLDEADAANCSDFDHLGVPAKKIILTNEIGSQPMRFSQFFGSGGTMMKINYKVEKLQP